MVSLVKTRYVVVLVMSDGTEQVVPKHGSYARRKKAETIQTVISRTAHVDAELVQEALRKGLPASAAKTSGIERVEVRTVV